MQAQHQTCSGDLSLLRSCEPTLSTQACLRRHPPYSLPCTGKLLASHCSELHISDIMRMSTITCIWRATAKARCCRYLRQESPLWSALHQGLLSGSSINAVLGFYEPQAAKRLGIPRGYVGHGKLLAAYRNLQLPAYVPSPADIANFGSAQAQQQLQEAASASASVPAASELHVAPAWSETADAERTSVDMTGKSKLRGGSKQRRGRRKGGVPPPVQAAGQALLGTKTITTYARPSSAEKELQLHRMSVCMRKAAEGVSPILVTCML